jgi:DNA-binding protein H-NS
MRKPWTGSRGFFFIFGSDGPAMSTLDEARKRQEELMEYLARLQRQKATMPPEREKWVTREIAAAKKEIGKLDREIQHMMMENRFKR